MPGSPQTIPEKPKHEPCLANDLLITREKRTAADKTVALRNVILHGRCKILGFCVPLILCSFPSIASQFPRQSYGILEDQEQEQQNQEQEQEEEEEEEKEDHRD